MAHALAVGQRPFWMRVADPGNPRHIPAPMPGSIVTVAV